MRQRKKWKPKGGYNEYRHILWEAIRFKWFLTMMPRVARAIATKKHEFSRAQRRLVKRRFTEHQ